MTSTYISTDFWNNKRVVVTGGSGFLGARVVQRLIALGASEVFVPRSINYNLVNAEDSIRLLKDTKPNIVMHLAAKVGGIGDNKLHPAEYFYENLMMGVQLFHSCWKQEIEKFVSVGTVCSYPKYAATPFSEDELWDGYPEEVKQIVANMMFNMGLTRLSKFRKHNAALQCGDWKEAAVEGRDSRWYKQVTKRAERLMVRLEAL